MQGCRPSHQPTQISAMIFNKKVTAIVLIKGETELVDGHMRLFNNRPLYRILLEKLENIFAVDEILVDTDIASLESEITSMFKKARFIHRIPELSGSNINVNQILEYDLTQTDNNEIFLQADINKPLLKKETIAKALKHFVEKEEVYDSLLSVTTYQQRFYDANHQPVNHDPKQLVRTKDLPPTYAENSCMYLFTRDSFKKNKHRVGANPDFFEMHPFESIELKDEWYYKLAEMLMLYKEL